MNTFSTLFGRAAGLLCLLMVLAATPSAAQATMLERLNFENNTFDSSPNTNDGIASGGTSYVVGKVGAAAIALDGTTGVVQLPNAVANQASLTVTAWVYWNGGGIFQRIFDFSSGTAAGLFLTPSSNSGYIRLGLYNGSISQDLNVGPALVTNTWVHVAATIGGNGTALYLNGQLVGQNTAATIRPADFNPTQNYIGKSPFNDPTFNGYVDDFRVYNYVLSAVEIATVADPNVYFQIQNRNTGLLLDGLNRPADGSVCGQAVGTTAASSYWHLTDVGDGFYQLQNRATGLLLNNLGSNVNGDAMHQSFATTSANAAWAAEPYSGGYYRIRNRGVFYMYLDGYGRTTTGDDAAQFNNSTSYNAQWGFVNPVSVPAPVATPLPVTLVAFEARAAGDGVQLNWKTASELNNSYFEVQRSVDGRTFAALGRVAGQGSKMTATSYAYFDAAASPAGPVYYRLRQVDADGQHQYSPVRVVRRGVEATLTLYPNPVRDVLTLRRAADEQVVSARIVAPNGQVYKRLTLGRDDNLLDVSDLPTGLYMLELSTAAGPLRARFAKQ